MKTKYLNFLMFISSFIPLYFLIVVKELIEIINGNLSFNITNTTMICINLLLIILGVLGVWWHIKKSNYSSIEIVEFKNITCENFLPYFPLFVLFALAFELEYISMAVVYILILIMIGIVYLKNNLYYINPFLNIIGYSTYEIIYLENNVKIKKRILSKSKPKRKCQTNGLFIK